LNKDKPAAACQDPPPLPSDSDSLKVNANTQYLLYCNLKCSHNIIFSIYILRLFPLNYVKSAQCQCQSLYLQLNLSCSSHTGKSREDSGASRKGRKWI
jgi:hypothetical protein